MQIHHIQSNITKLRILYKPKYDVAVFYPLVEVVYNLHISS